MFRKFTKEEHAAQAIEYALAEPKTFDLGNDNLPYAVFRNNVYSWEYCDHIGGFGIACFGNYENAVLIQETIGL